jgi:DNA (cytosine-5)-methyltransferase 1
MLVNSFFCGAGGFDLGFIQAGYKVAAAYEWDKYAVESYKANIDKNIEVTDITTLTGPDIPRASVWTFGFPCQDLSQAITDNIGLFEGNKSSMFFQIMRLLGEVAEKPSIILAENVAGLKPYLGVLEEEYKKAGYRMYYTRYNSKSFGLAQSRDRYFVIGVREDIEREFTFPYVNVSAAKLSDILESEVAAKLFIDDSKAEGIIGNEFPAPMENEIKVIGHIDIKGHDLIKRVYHIEGISPTLNACTGGNRQPKVLIDNKVRKLSPREFARLQGFRDSYKQVVSDSQFYKQMGNAVSVPIAHTIATRIKHFLANSK